MNTYGARVSVRSAAALSGLAILGTLAGCSAQSISATVSGPTAEATSPVTAVEATASAAPSATPSTSVPSAGPTTVAKAPVPAKTTAPAAAPSATPTASSTPTPTVVPTTYKDGNYSATGTYGSPGGKETLRVTLDMSKDIITALAVTSVKIDSTAANYEAAFEGGIQAIVVGKDIDALNVGPVAGSSLTSIGFNRAVATIKDLARN